MDLKDRYVKMLKTLRKHIPSMYIDMEWNFIYDAYNEPVAFNAERFSDRNPLLSKMVDDRGHLDIPRVYHTLEHIERCLKELEGVPEALVVDRTLVEYALFYHDVVYKTDSFLEPLQADNRTSNEDKSASMALNSLYFFKLDEDDILDKIERLILATKHNEVQSSPDCKLIADIDLASLGSDWESFARDGEGIKTEYSLIPEEDYWKGRLAFLNGMLGRDRIYQTDYFRDKYEEQARENIQRAIFEIPNYSKGVLN
jgi:predicted metal-dependent HD superfamily phosphohydrolase